MGLLLIVHWILLTVLTAAIQANIILSKLPQSRNVSAHTLEEFTCATEEINVTTLVITTQPASVKHHLSKSDDLPNGGKQHTLSIVVPSEYSYIIIRCTAVRIPDVRETTAILMIQGLLSGVGDLTSSEVDHCTLHFTWTAPYTLQGVPINYYTINITRHSDGAVLKSDTTNTTEYLYTVSSPGEALEVVVAAVNGAGTGDVSAHVLNASTSSFEFPISGRSRHTNGWRIESVIKIRMICDGYNKVTVHLHDESSGLMYNTTANITTLSDGRTRLVAHFIDVPEDRHYQATVKVHYHQIIQHSIVTETNTFDIFHISHTILPEAIQVTVVYVEGNMHNRFCAKLHCTSENISNTFIGSSGMIDGVPPNELCTLMVTDYNGMSLIDTRAAVTIDNIIVPIATVIPSTNSTNNTTVTQTTPTDEGDNQRNVGIIISGVVAALIVLAVAAAAAVTVLLIMPICIAKLVKASRNGKSRTRESNPDLQIEPESACDVHVVKPSSAELEFAVESGDQPPLVPPHTADSEVLNPSTGQPPNKHQNEKRLRTHIHILHVPSNEPSPFPTPRGNQIKTNYTENETSGAKYQQPSQGNDPPPLPPRREDTTNSNEQPQYIEVAKHISPGETVPQQPLDAGLGGTVYSIIDHTATV